MNCPWRSVYVTSTTIFNFGKSTSNSVKILISLFLRSCIKFLLIDRVKEFSHRNCCGVFTSCDKYKYCRCYLYNDSNACNHPHTRINSGYVSHGIPEERSLKCINKYEGNEGLIKVNPESIFAVLEKQLLTLPKFMKCMRSLFLFIRF